jgi:DNA-binding transcriptional LysR family regulator
MDLDLLQTFLAIYRAGTLTAAARALHLSQPAVTQQLKTLEGHAGKPLFVRLARGVAPTPAAHALARDIAGPLDALEAAGQRLRPGAGDLAGTVVIGGPADLLATKALPALVPLVDQGVRLRVRTGLADDLLGALADGELDLVIATRRTRRSGLDYEPLFDEDFVLVAAPSWARRIDPGALRAAGLAALADVPIVAYAEDLPIIRRWFRAAFTTRLTTAAAIVIDDLRGVMTAVAAGAGITVLPRYLAADLIASGDLVDLHPGAQAPANTLYLATRSDQPDRARILAVAQQLRRTAPTWPRPT